MGRLLEADPFTGIKQIFRYEPGTDTVLLEDVSDLSPALEANEAFRQHETGNWRGDMHLVASIPPLIADDLYRRGILQDKKKLAKWLCDRDNLKLRTKSGRL